MKILRLLFLILPFSLLAPGSASAQRAVDPKLERSIRQIIAGSNATIGVAMQGLDFPASLLINDDHHYPMQSVYKLPLAMAVLEQVEGGKLQLDQPIIIKKHLLDTATWSPLVKDFPDQDIHLTLATLLRYTISKSDNNGCDALFRLLGGTAVANQYVGRMGITGMAIATTEAEIKTGWQVQYRNWCKPSAMCQLLRLLSSGRALNADKKAFLLQLMTDSENSPNRVLGDLPEGTIWAHKTGTSGISKKGQIAATNDVGILILPNGRHLAIVVFVSDYQGSIARGEQLIASIGRAIWDAYAQKKR